MIGYATVGTDDIVRARQFYDGLLAVLGGREIMRIDEGFTVYGAKRGEPMLAVTPPNDGGKASAGNGAMIALATASTGQVDELHAKALELGGSDEGAPGSRGDFGSGPFYAAYFRDPDGNKFCAYIIAAED